MNDDDNRFVPTTATVGSRIIITVGTQKYRALVKKLSGFKICCDKYIESASEESAFEESTSVGKLQNQHKVPGSRQIEDEDPLSISKSPSRSSMSPACSGTLPTDQTSTMPPTRPSTPTTPSTCPVSPTTEDEASEVVNEQLEIQNE